MFRNNCGWDIGRKFVELLFLEVIYLKGARNMTLEKRLIINSNAFFTTQDRNQLVVDEYEKQFKIALMQTKKPLPTSISND